MQKWLVGYPWEKTMKYNVARYSILSKNFGLCVSGHREKSWIGSRRCSVAATKWLCCRRSAPRNMSNLSEYDWADWPDDEGSLYRDVVWNTTENEYPPDTPGCQLYNFIMYAVLGGSVCLLGCVGNVLAFVVFWRDKVKTSTSLLFQVRSHSHYFSLAIRCNAATLPVCGRHCHDSRLFARVVEYAINNVYLQFLIFQDGGRPSSWIFIVQNLNCWSGPEGQYASSYHLAKFRVDRSNRLPRHHDFGFFFMMAAFAILDF